ncbi:metal ABC transporter permease [Egibacter rhizosphaerae]|uniref:Metal ABC transporter permease n=1 Tax=Egibacter rhizosphaerae TaxID=1670831 RepID=A0A411YE25_9ACTN|nr:metal ABC transporter permease [Egibacter rhizosphaerae]QBI19494.1 metal ABC transporter permease [Egibacter rhizosphaerae]
MSWPELLTEPFTYDFFVRAMAAGLLVGALCGAISVFIVLRRMSYVGHGLAHSVLGGVAVGVALGYHEYLGAVVATLVSALLIDRITRRRGLHADAAIGIVTTALFALGIAVVSRLDSPRVSTEALLFGNPLAVTSTDLWLAVGVAGAFTATLFAYYKPLVFVSFDPEVARVHGVRAGLMELLFNVLTAAVVIVSVRVLGVLLVAAAVVIPAAFARLVTHSFGAMVAIATAVGVVSSVVGLYGSYHLDVASGPMIVLTGAALFAVAFTGTALRTRSRLRRARSHGDVARPAPTV